MAFLHEPIPGLIVPELPKANIDGIRYYLDDANKPLPSVTSILDKTADKEFLVKWKKRIGEDQAAIESARAKERGHRLHTAMEEYILTDKLPEKMNPFDMVLFQQYKKAIDKNMDAYCGIEVPLFSHIYGMAGTTDLVSRWCSHLAVVDFKGSNRPKKLEWIKDYLLQTALYSLMVEDMTGVRIDQMVIIVGSIELPEAQVFVESRRNYENAALLRLAQFKKEFA